MDLSQGTKSCWQPLEARREAWMDSLSYHHRKQPCQLSELSLQNYEQWYVSVSVLATHVK
jgi:hypothetical protein